MASGNVSKGMMLLSEVIESIDAVGISKTRDHLQKLYKDKIKFDNPTAEKVITKVSEVTGVPVHEIINGTGRANERKMAIGFCSYYFLYSYKFDMRDIVVFLRRERTGCYKYAYEIIALKPGHEAHKKYCEWKKSLDGFFPVAVIDKLQKNKH